MKQRLKDKIIYLKTPIAFQTNE